jgi:hypothetical protein
MSAVPADPEAAVIDFARHLIESGRLKMWRV